jgi:hypothetical protein
VTGSVLGPTDLWGRGYGTEAARLRASYAFDVLGLRLLLSEAMDGNTASVRMLLKAGYVQTGRIPRRHWKRGAWRDALLFALERPGPQSHSSRQGVPVEQEVVDEAQVGQAERGIEGVEGEGDEMALA